MQIVLSQSSPVPLYEQIREQIREAIFTGAIAPGESLPSLRELARDLQVSLITTTRAYNDLATDGVIATRPGKGAVALSVGDTHIAKLVTARVREGLDAAIAAAAMGGMGLDELTAELGSRWAAHGSPIAGKDTQIE